VQGFHGPGKQYRACGRRSLCLRNRNYRESGSRRLDLASELALQLEVGNEADQEKANEHDCEGDADSQDAPIRHRSNLRRCLDL
jgi:hypothetical protein